MQVQEAAVTVSENVLMGQMWLGSHSFPLLMHNSAKQALQWTENTTVTNSNSLKKCGWWVSCAAGARRRWQQKTQLDGDTDK